MHPSPQNRQAAVRRISTETSLPGLAEHWGSLRDLAWHRERRMKTRPAPREGLTSLRELPSLPRGAAHFRLHCRRHRHQRQEVAWRPEVAQDYALANRNR